MKNKITIEDITAMTEAIVIERKDLIEESEMNELSNDLYKDRESIFTLNSVKKKSK